MADLMRIFGPVADNDPRLLSVDIVAFDIMGTLIHHDGKTEDDVLKLFYHIARRADVETVLMSSDPAMAGVMLYDAGCRHPLLTNVRRKVPFFMEADSAEKRVLAVDDDAFASSLAEICIDPRSRQVKDYLRARGWRDHAPERS